MEKFFDGLSKVCGGLLMVLLAWLIVDQFQIDKKISNVFKDK